MVNGIDVSAFQPNVSFSAVHAAGFSFVYIKATQSTNYTSETFAAQWQGAGAAGMLRGGYHFFDFNADAQAQAEYFLSACPPQSGALPPMLDLEQVDGVPASTAQNVQSVATWLNAVQKATGVRPVLYLNYPCWSGPLGSTSGFSGHPFWAPSYLSGVTKPPPSGAPPIMQPPPPQITPWAKWTFWQYSDAGVVAGVPGTVDLDVFSGSLDELRALCQK
ncbi:MAG TPA: glycoside hydrolase family 25 protein [Candidatus Elarobacter sp.]|jgi:lysozyme|nr:glycoside hydrolase family 25 protein [Candidatus Elarobacter sp.]